MTNVIGVTLPPTERKFSASDEWRWQASAGV